MITTAEESYRVTLNMHIYCWNSKTIGIFSFNHTDIALRSIRRLSETNVQYENTENQHQT